MKIFVSAKPNSKIEKIEQIDKTHFNVSVKAPPVKGLANRAIAKVLAEYFDLSPSRVNLISGYTSRQKVFEIL